MRCLFQVLQQLSVPRFPFELTDHHHKALTHFHHQQKKVQLVALRVLCQAVRLGKPSLQAQKLNDLLINLHRDRKLS